MDSAGFFSVSTLLVILAAALDIIANMFVTCSRGFKRLWFGVAAYIFVAGAFYSLSLAVRHMDLAVAYAMWGAFGIIGTSLGGWFVFRQVPGPLAWVGMGVLVCGMILLH